MVPWCAQFIPREMICGKQTFTSRTDAVNHMKGIRAAQHYRNDKKVKMTVNNAYYCEACKGWHLTSGGKKRNQKGKNRTEEVNGKEQKKINHSWNHKTLIIHNRLKFKIK